MLKTAHIANVLVIYRPACVLQINLLAYEIFSDSCTELKDDKKTEAGNKTNFRHHCNCPVGTVTIHLHSNYLHTDPVLQVV